MCGEEDVLEAAGPKYNFSSEIADTFEPHSGNNSLIGKINTSPNKPNFDYSDADVAKFRNVAKSNEIN